MRQRIYVVAFVCLVVLACAAGALAGRYLWQRFQQDFAPRQTWSPPGLEASPSPRAVVVPTTALPTRLPSTTATRPSITTPRPVTLTPIPPTAQPTVAPTSTEAPSGPPLVSPTPSLTPGATPSPTRTPQPAYEYVLARPVRHSTGDCPGTYILGLVTDRAGNPLPGVRLWLVDEYGNQDTKVTKSGATDLGRYDFPVFPPPRRFYLSVVDATGHPVSPRIEIAHGMGSNADASCHWVDWQRQ